MTARRQRPIDPPQRCYYAEHPASRPRCTLTASEQVIAAKQTLTTAITRARQTCTSWAAIATQLGITRQAAQQRFTRASTRESTKRATRAH